jgi:Outer membrane protein beta-barrel domain
VNCAAFRRFNVRKLCTWNSISFAPVFCSVLSTIEMTGAFYVGNRGKEQMRIAGLVVAIVVLSCFAVAQEENGLELSASGASVFSKSSTANNGSNVTLKPTTSFDLIATVGYRFNRWNGLQFNYARTRNSQIFTVPPDTYRVMVGITEYSGAYVFTPFATAKFKPFLFAGAGALRFSPGNTYIDQYQITFGAAGQTALAYLYGGGVDYHFYNLGSRTLSFRLQYRGLIYKAPDFGLPSLFYTGARGHMAEPAAGIVLKF